MVISKQRKHKKTKSIILYSTYSFNRFKKSQKDNGQGFTHLNLVRLSLSSRFFFYWCSQNLNIKFLVPFFHKQFMVESGNIPQLRCHSFLKIFLFMVNISPFYAPYLRVSSLLFLLLSLLISLSSAFFPFFIPCHPLLISLPPTPAKFTVRQTKCTISLCYLLK